MTLDQETCKIIHFSKFSRACKILLGPGSFIDTPKWGSLLHAASVHTRAACWGIEPPEHSELFPQTQTHLILRSTIFLLLPSPPFSSVLLSQTGPHSGQSGTCLSCRMSAPTPRSSFAKQMPGPSSFLYLGLSFFIREMMIVFLRFGVSREPFTFKANIGTAGFH